jgi:hypothetical protein
MAHVALEEKPMSKIKKAPVETFRSSSLAATSTVADSPFMSPLPTGEEEVPDLDEDSTEASAGPAAEPRRRFKEVWLVEDRKNARSVWTRVGTAFENADGSWNIRLSAVPLGGRLNIRDPLPRERAVTA